MLSNTDIMRKIYTETFLYNNMVDCHVMKQPKVISKVSGWSVQNLYY